MQSRDPCRRYSAVRRNSRFGEIRHTSVARHDVARASPARTGRERWMDRRRSASPSRHQRRARPVAVVSVFRVLRARVDLSPARRISGAGGDGGPGFLAATEGARNHAVDQRGDRHTSGRRFLERGPWRTLMLCGWLVMLWTFGMDTERYSERWRGPADQTPGTRWPRARWSEGKLAPSSDRKPRLRERSVARACGSADTPPGVEVAQQIQGKAGREHGHAAKKQQIIE